MFPRIVNRSVSAWQGCRSSESPLITGHRESWAKFSINDCEKVRITIEVGIRAQDAGHVRQRFAAIQPGVVRREEHAPAAELNRGRLEAVPRSQRRFFENERQHPSLQERAGDHPRQASLEIGRDRKDGLDVCRRDIENGSSGAFAGAAGLGRRCGGLCRLGRSSDASRRIRSRPVPFTRERALRTTTDQPSSAISRSTSASASQPASTCSSLTLSAGNNRTTVSCVTLDQHSAMHALFHSRPGRNRQVDADHHPPDPQLADDRQLVLQLRRDACGSGPTCAGSCRAAFPLRSCGPSPTRPPWPADFRRTCWRACRVAGSWRPPCGRSWPRRRRRPPSPLANVMTSGCTGVC